MATSSSYPLRLPNALDQLQPQLQNLSNLYPEDTETLNSFAHSAIALSPIPTHYTDIIYGVIDRLQHWQRSQSLHPGRLLSSLPHIVDLYASQGIDEWSEMPYIQAFDPGHADRVTAVDFNYDGSKLLTASIDHKVKVWQIENGVRSQLETFTAHDAHIRDAKWFSPAAGTHLVTIGNDLKLCIWQEDTTQAPNSGRRFRRLSTIHSQNHSPFVSVDVRSVSGLYHYLAVVDRSGLLSIYEPTNAVDFKEWTLLDQFYVLGQPAGRNELTSFKVKFDQNIVPLSFANGVSDDVYQLGLVVTSMRDVKIFRSIIPSAGNSSSMSAEHVSDQTGASHRLVFYEAARVPRHPSLVRDVAWAPANFRGSDLIATACSDGTVRIYEVFIDRKPGSSSPKKSGNAFASSSSSAGAPSGGSAPAGSTDVVGSRQQQQQPQQQPPPRQRSTLTSAFAASSISKNNNNGNENDGNDEGGEASTSQPHRLNAALSAPALSAAVSAANPRTSHVFGYDHSVVPVASIERAHDDAWQVVWDPQGQVLVSGGADGVTKIWRRSIVDGEWLLFADQAVDMASGGYPRRTGTGSSRAERDDDYEYEEGVEEWSGEDGEGTSAEGAEEDESGESSG